MIKALMLIFAPNSTWDGVKEDRRGIAYVLFVYLVPFFAMVYFLEAYGLAHWGKERMSGLPSQVFKDLKVLKVYAAGQFIISLLTVFMGAKIIQMFAAASFHCRRPYATNFLLVAYALAPMYLCTVLNIIPFLPWWLAWIIGIVIAVSSMYHGVPRIMDPDPPQAFGIYFACSVVLTMLTGIARFLTGWWLDGRFLEVQRMILDSPFTKWM
jgi:hypothetical protein